MGCQKFIDEFIEFNSEGRTKCKVIYDRYKNWIIDRKIYGKPSRKLLYLEIKKYATYTKSTQITNDNNTSGFIGVTLK